MRIVWAGPYGWPKYEGDLPVVPDHSGVYLQTVKFRDGYLIYAAGVSARSIRERFAAHTRKYLSGDYNVLDIDALQHGVRLEIWHGWWWGLPEKRILFENRKLAIVDAVHKQLTGFRIFVANLDVEKRILERLESSIMKTLAEQPRPFCDIPDEGMWLARRASSENPISVTNQCSSKLFGIPGRFEI